MEFSETQLDTRRGPRTAVVATPSSHLRVDLARLRELRELQDGNQLDDHMLGACRRAKDPRIFVFRGKNGDGSGSWGFDDSLSEEEVEDLAYLLVGSHLITYRRMVAVGILAIVHVELGFREVSALRDGTARLRSELERQSTSESTTPAQAALHEFDLWILRHLTFFFSVSSENVMAKTLPDMIPMIEQRDPHLRELIEQLPPGVV